MQAKTVGEECNEVVILNRKTWWTGDHTRELVIKVLPVQCEWCEEGFMPESATSCKCVAVKVPVVEGAQIFTPNDVKVDSVTPLVLPVGANVIFREWAVQGQFAWTFASATELACISPVGETYAGTYFQ